MMKKYLLTLIALVVFISFSCNINDLVSEVANGKITAKEKLGEVINKAKSDFASDSKLAVIYGRDVSTSGEIDPMFQVIFIISFSRIQWLL